MTLSAQIRKARTERGLAQVDLAQLCGRSQSWVSLVESGARCPLNPEDIHALAAALGIRPRVLLRWAGFDLT